MKPDTTEIRASRDPRVRVQVGELSVTLTVPEALTLRDEITSALKPAMESDAATLVLLAVSDFYHVPVAAMTGPGRPEAVVCARQVAMYLLRRVCGLSQNVVGDAMGGRDHGTVLHAERAVETRMSTYPTTWGVDVETLARQIAQAGRHSSFVIRHSAGRPA